MMSPRNLLALVANRVDAIKTDEKAVSIALDHALGLLVLLTLSGVFTAGITSINDNRQEAVAEQELERISEEVAASLTAVDRLALQADRYEDLSGGSTANATAITQLPDSIGGQSYAITVAADGTINVISGDVNASTTVSLQHDIQAKGTGGGDLLIFYDASTDTIKIRGA